MRDRFSGSMTALAIAAAVGGAVISMSITRTSAQAPAASVTAPATAPALKTPWGEPDLQGIWTDESDTPLQRSRQVCEPGIFHRGAAGRIGHSSDRRCSAATGVWSAGPSSTSPAPTTRCS